MPQQFVVRFDKNGERAFQSGLHIYLIAERNNNAIIRNEIRATGVVRTRRFNKIIWDDTPREVL